MTLHTLIVKLQDTSAEQIQLPVKDLLALLTRIQNPAWTPDSGHSVFYDLASERVQAGTGEAHLCALVKLADDCRTGRQTLAVLKVIAEFPRVTCKMISVEVGVGMTEARGALARLANLGLVFSIADRGRGRVWSCTEEGRTVCAELGIQATPLSEPQLGLYSPNG